MARWGLILLLLGGCQRRAPVSPPNEAPPRANCQSPVFNGAVPGVTSTMNVSEFWTAQYGQAADLALMDPDQIAALNARNQGTHHGVQDILAPHITDRNRVAKELNERFVWLTERLKDGRLVEGNPGDYDKAETIARTAAVGDELRVVHTEATLHCVPLTTGLYALPVDKDFDRNRCSGLHPGEVVRVMRVGRGDWLYVHTGHAVGWLAPGHVTPGVSADTARDFMSRQPRLVVMRDRVMLPGGPVMRIGNSLPLVNRANRTVLAPTPEGLVERQAPTGDAMREGFVALTRRNVIQLAISQLGRPYGWGGYKGERDCSRLIMDVLATTGLSLNRHSAAQAKGGRHTVELAGLTRDEKLARIREAGQRGVVLLYMKGHIMMYLGEVDGKPYAISSLSEYKRPCGEDGQVVRVDRVAISDLELGQGTDKTAFLERLTRLAVFAP